MKGRRSHKIKASVVHPSIYYFYPPPTPYQFCAWPRFNFNLFQKKYIYLVLFNGYVRLIQFMGRALRLGQAKGAECCGYEGVWRCGHMSNYIHVLHMRCMYKMDRRGGGRGVQKSFSRILPTSVLSIGLIWEIFRKTHRKEIFGNLKRQRKFLVSLLMVCGLSVCFYPIW